MKLMRKTLKPVSVGLAVLMLLVCMPVHSVLAAMIKTETVMDTARGQEAREYLHQLLARQEVQTALIAHGITPLEAKARIDSLSDGEVIRIADQIDQLPAGGDSFLAVVLGIAILIFIILVITDLTGVTDVFPFIKAQR
ncbi:MAG: PA2779 family protein [Desulfobacterales bacterium]|nr:MAG: PA2779 family protein [Desulfobacterales bacterium]